MTQKTALSRRSFLKAVGAAPVIIGISFIVPGCAPAKDPRSFLLSPAGLAPAQVNGNFFKVRASRVFSIPVYTKSLYCLCRCCVCSMRARNTGTMMPDLVL
jgi:hypothetical protein